MQYFLYILIAILILLLMILIHELGHYFAGKILKFKIDEFSVGFGPKLLQKKRWNGEKISLRAIPLGGYCAFYGDEDEDAKNDTAKDEIIPDLNPAGSATAVHSLSAGSRAEIALPKESAAIAEGIPAEGIPFNAQKPWKRIVVLLSGALFNFFSAFIFSFIYILVVGYSLPVVDSVYTDGTKPYSDLLAGDVIIAVDGSRIGVLSSFSELVADKEEGDTQTFTVRRGGNEIDIVATYQMIDELEKVAVGFKPKYEAVNGNAGDAFLYCVPYTFKLSWSILGSFGKIITGQVALTELSGPIGTVAAIAEYSMVNWRNILLFLPLIASNLAIFNLLPIPALDGMKVIFTAVEGVRKKPISRKVENIISGVGLIVLFTFVILIDIIGLITRML